MAVVEIHIKDGMVHEVEGMDAYVYVHDHDIQETTLMTFKKQETIYEDRKSLEPDGFPDNETNTDKGEQKDDL